MIKIGIITLFHNNYNYGGQLQAYAMQRVFSTEISEATLISFSLNSKKYYIRRFRYLGVKKSIISVINKIKYKTLLLNREFKDRVRNKKIRFDEFMDLSKHSIVYSESDIRNCNEEFDQFVCGSDQIWNPGWWNEVFFLSFTNKRKYSYGASLARNSLSHEEMDYIKKNTKEYYAISVREEQAKIVLEDSISRKVELVLDPTFLISREEWTALSVKPNIQGEYVLLYMLGNSKQIKKKVYDFCKEKGYRLVTIGFSKNTYFSSDVLFNDIVIADAGPREWLGWIKHAELIFTDSFHGSVFSILFGKQFWCFERDNPNDISNENSRIYSLLNITGLSSRLIGSYSNSTFNEDNKICFSDVNQRIQPHLRASLDFIHKCIGENDA